MGKFYYLIIVISIMLMPVVTLAQEENSTRQLYEQAESAYQIGRLKLAIDLLKNNMNKFNGNSRQNALRLISICYLAQDSIAESENYARLLLKINPYYTSVQDPIRFEDMITRLKYGEFTTITTASSQAESVNEAPVPVTIISHEMIESLSNNKSLGQILATFVPGMNEVSSYQLSNIAMHGVYTASQEKILIMENGHRLNIRTTNNGKLDYAISTEKIDHIEVLRGPASSLYGNVALTAVVNIITKNGNSINGIKGKYGYGTHQTQRADLIGGTTLFGSDVVAWASIYTSKGQRIDVPQYTGYSMTKHDGYTYVGRYEGRPSYDLGASIKLYDFNLAFNRKYGKQVPQYSWYGETYDYDCFRTIGGVKPGYSIDETHLELAYSRSVGSVNLNVSAFGDWYDVQDYMAVSDSALAPLFDSKGKTIVIDGTTLKMLYHGLMQYLDFKEYTIGLIVKADAPYHIGKMHGNLLCGAQFEHFKLSANDFCMGDNYTEIFLVSPEDYNMLYVKHEQSMSGFIQDKHYLASNLILNAGLRYDYKLRANNNSVSALSPRLALIFMPNAAFSMKLSYSQSFVDAPYYTRQNTTNGAKGSENLMPEYMHAVQLDFLGKLNKYHLTYDLNLFYNRLTNTIVNNPSPDPTMPKYINAGSLRVAGVEGMLMFQHPSLQLHAVVSYQRPLDAESYYYSDHQVYGIPTLTGNFNASKRLLNKKRHSLSLTGNLHYQTKTLVKANPNVIGSADFHLDAFSIFDLGLRYAYNDFFQLSLDCDNVLDKTYYIGGSFYVPYQGLGRVAMATLSFQL